MITTQRAKSIAYTLMGLSEELVEETCEQMFDLRESSLVSYEEFQLVYFELFKTLQLAEGKQIDFDHFDQINSQADHLTTDHNKHINNQELHTEHTLYDEAHEDSNTF